MLTDIVAGLVLFGFLTSTTLFAVRATRRPRANLEGLLFSVTGGILFLILVADRMPGGYIEGRGILTVLPWSPEARFASPAWIVWATALFYVLRAVVFNRLEKRYEWATQRAGSLASYLALSVVTVELVARIYDIGFIGRMFLLATGIGLFYLPWSDLLQVIATTFSKGPRILARYIPRVLRNFGAYFGFVLAFLADLRRFWKFGATYERWMDGLLEDQDDDVASSIDGRLADLNEKIERQEEERNEV